MSKTKTKRARRELKREGDRKIMAHHRKLAKATETKASTSATPAAKTTAAAKHQAKRQKTTHTRSESTAATTAAPTQTPKTPQTHHQPSQQNHPIPFSPYDHILLVGEGDFSFTHSLAVAHGCANVTATCYDSLEEARAKYPRFDAIRHDLEALAPPVPLHYGIDATKISGYKGLRCRRDEDEGGFDDDDDEGVEGGGGGEDAGAGAGAGAAAAGKKGKRQGYDTIVFQFPHTGGLSTDQNRQVRANQHLLVSFFNAVLETPTPKHRIAQLLAQASPASASNPRGRPPPFLRPNGKIIVTLFEGEPYTLWNIRDLARHVGLKVLTSFAFDASQYPGYAHVRTLGAVESGWKGEDRKARMYVFEKVALVPDRDEEDEMRRVRVRMRGGGKGSQKGAFRGVLEGVEGGEEGEGGDH